MFISIVLFLTITIHARYQDSHFTEKALAPLGVDGEIPAALWNPVNARGHDLCSGTWTPSLVSYFTFAQIRHFHVPFSFHFPLRFGKVERLNAWRPPPVSLSLLPQSPLRSSFQSFRTFLNSFPQIQLRIPLCCEYVYSLPVF